ncbi:MAG: ferredoxin--NADP reductase [Acidimicrobiia bacterium]|nr:ferredoxin--NADP reductase [Acidimicrobiia bacterium]NNF10601.1 ferredoxin--NADP reductase [Acidimicrobiia bacterium]
MVRFSDRRTPDLVFDHVIYALGSGAPDRHLERLNITLKLATDQPSVYILTEEDPGPGASSPQGVVTVSPGHAWRLIHDHHLGDFDEPGDLTARPPLVFAGLAERLREKHYNATITSFENHHSDLWILRVKPDVGDARHEPGQYATLALGYWEPRLDGSDEQLNEDKIEKLVRRSYSISHPMLDENDRLVAPEDIDGLEFYIVLVRPEGMEHLPELTPRLALKKAGDRIFMGAKVAGRYTLKSVTSPDQDVVFLSTGTGEAPHNNMAAQLLRDGHRGRIVSACTVRYQRDLAYLETHRRMEKLFPNYRYFALTTREADTINNKVYIQDMITNGMLEDVLGYTPTPGKTEFFLCGNPAMIGLPEEWGDGSPEWPEPRGVCEILTGMGFTVDRRGVEGNVHYEEYW